MYNLSAVEILTYRYRKYNNMVFFVFEVQAIDLLPGGAGNRPTLNDLVLDDYACV